MVDYASSQTTELFVPEEKYMLYAEPEVVRVLRDLAKKPSIITAYLDGDASEHFKTFIVTVLPERKLVVLDYGPFESVNKKALKAKTVTCVTQHDFVQIQFQLSGLQRAKFQGEPAFAAPLPRWVYRPQRREFFRVNAPQANPIKVEMDIDGELKAVPMVDLSLGGMGLQDDDEVVTAQPGDILPHCRFELPGFGTVATDLRVCNRFTVRDPRGEEKQRLGCEFTGLSPENNQIIQRYLHMLQLEQRKQK